MPTAVLRCATASLLLIVPLISFGQDTPSVRIEKAVSYLPADRAEKADLYLPPKSEEGKKYPGILIIHGGGWTGGKRDAAREINIGTTLALNGYVCLSTWNRAPARDH